MKNLLLSALVILSLTASAQDKKKCTAQTKAKTQCGNYAKEGETTCTIHSPNTPRCGEPTKKGDPCKSIVKEKGQHCHRHTK